MSDERDKKDDPAMELMQGLTHLWKAARGVATEVKKEVERTDIGKELTGAGREFVRAAANVVDRIADEVGDLTRSRKPEDKRQPPPRDGGAPPEEDEFDGVKPKAKQGEGSPDDAGFRIAVDDKKKSS